MNCRRKCDPISDWWFFSSAPHDLQNTTSHTRYIPRNTARRTCDGRTSVSCCSASHKQRPARLERKQGKKKGEQLGRGGSEFNVAVISLEISPSVWIVAHGTSCKRKKCFFHCFGMKCELRLTEEKHSGLQVFQLALVLEPHLHLIVEVSEQGPQLPSWHSFSHR